MLYNKTKEQQNKMSTSVATPTTSALDITSEVITSARVTYDTGEKDSNQEPILDAVVVSEDQGREAEKSATIQTKVKGKTETYPVVAVEYESFVYYKANTLQGVTELCPSDEEVCNMFNRGISVKQQNKARSLLLEKDDDGAFVFAFTETAFDLKPTISEVTNRRLSPTEKVLETLKTMPPEQRAAIAAALAALQQ